MVSFILVFILLFSNFSTVIAEEKIIETDESNHVEINVSPNIFNDQVEEILIEIDANDQLSHLSLHIYHDDSKEYIGEIEEFENFNDIENIFTWDMIVDDQTVQEKKKITDGKYYLEAVDHTSNKVVGKTEFVIHSEKPEILLSQVKDNGLVILEENFISGHIHTSLNDEELYGSYSIVQDGERYDEGELSLESDGYFDIEDSLPEGESELTIEVIDAAGNESEEFFKLSLQPEQVADEATSEEKTEVQTFSSSSDEGVTPPYEIGDNYEVITEMKEKLTKLGFGNFPDNPSSVYGSVTAGVVEDFQEYYGLSETGVADQETLDKIDEILVWHYQPGNNADEFIELKLDLTALGFGNFPENPSNVYGNVTASVVKEFQEYHGLVVSGIAEEVTLAKIEDLLSLPYESGDSHGYITEMKEKLTQLGFGSFPTNPSNVYGSVTSGVVEDFQEYYGLPVTGVADQETLDKIDKILAWHYQPGHSADEFVEMKQKLTLLGFGNFPASPSNVYGNVTAGVVKDFQEHYDLPVSGIADEKTLAKMEEILSPPYQSGEQGAHIVNLKEKLTRLGFGNFPASPSNVYGSVTAGVVEDFQEYYGLPVTGVADQETLDKIDEILVWHYQPGNSADEFVEMKKNLTLLGFGNFPAEPSDVYGNVTAAVVKQFQEYYGLPTSGIADERTLEKINSLLPPYEPGDNHDGIVKLKEDLTRLGFGNFPSSPSSAYGSVTAGVVEEFQEYYGLEVNGIADETTLAKMHDILTGLYTPGNRSQSIVELKEDLTKLGFGNFPSNPSNAYGSVTAGVVEEFQAYYGLAVSGIADEVTLAKINEVLASPYSPGNSSASIADMKKDLTKLGFGNFSSNPTNVYGSVTAGVVEEFQAYYGLAVSGIADEVTLAKMNEILTSPYTEGNSSSSIAELKNKLTILGFGNFPSNPSNAYGSVTAGVVKEFQQYYGLVVNGIADEVTLAKIEEILPPYRIGDNHQGIVKLKRDLTEIGFGNFPSNPSSAYGSITANVVAEFQRNFGLSATGIVNEATLLKIREVKPSPRKIVNGRQNYSYNQMVSDIRELEERYPNIVETTVIGQSLDGRDIYAVKLGRGSTEVFFNASSHAREHMTTNVLMKMMDEYAYAYANGNSIDGYNVQRTLNRTSIWFVPMWNPDGVTLVQDGPGGINSSSLANEAVRINNGSTNFTSWKANVRGVDINRQFPALWDTISGDPGRPSESHYKGPNPLSEPEARAVYDFVLTRDFKTALSYHSSGEVIYTRHPGHVANIVSNKTGYNIVDLTWSNSGGGFSDWFVLEQGKPGLTPEISPYVGDRPVPLSNWNRVWNQNDSVGLIVADEAYRNRNSR